MFTVGDKVPADIRIIKIFSTTLRVDQAILTGKLTMNCYNRNIVNIFWNRELFLGAVHHSVHCWILRRNISFTSRM